MKEPEKKDIDQKVFDLYDAYAHNKIDRRSFMEQLSMYAVGGVSMSYLLSNVMPDYAQMQISEEDPRVQSEYITYQSEKGGGKIKALLSLPADTNEKLGGIIVVHENRGLNPHIEDVGRRAALAGFVSLAPDALTPVGGYPGNDDDGRALQKQRDKLEMLEDFIAAFKYLKNHPRCNGNVGVVGFCFGGWVSNMMAAQLPDLKAAVPFYGRQADIELVPNIETPLLLQFGELDTRVNEGWPAYEEALKKHGKDYQAYIYPHANHGFHNDTTGRYDKEQAQLAWKRTIEFFNKHLNN